MTFKAVVISVTRGPNGRNVGVEFQNKKENIVEESIVYSNVLSMADLELRVAIRLQELLDRYEDVQGKKDYLGKTVGTI